MSTQHSPGGVVASDGTNGRLSPETITDLGIKHGVFRKEDRAAVVARAKADPSAVLTVVCARLSPAGPVTPATPATARSGAAVAAGSGVPAVTYPSTWSRAVSAAQRITGSRKQRTARTAWPTAVPTRAAAAGQGRSQDGFHSKDVQASSSAAAQQSRHEADLARMAAEQRARGIG